MPGYPGVLIGEFTFGLIPEIAFSNMKASPSKVLATVAMVYRPNPIDGRDQMLFMAYDANGNLTDNAPLDRHGINFANGFAAAGNVNPSPALFGTPGTEFNNHIPSNCLSCHGGSYDEVAGSVGENSREARALRLLP